MNPRTIRIYPVFDYDKTKDWIYERKGFSALGLSHRSRYRTSHLLPCLEFEASDTQQLTQFAFLRWQVLLM